MSARRTGVFILALVATFAFLLLPSWNTWRFYRASTELSSEELRLQRLIGDIVHLDEVLTMSARMAAATGDPRWEHRYLENAPHLDAVVDEAIRLTPREYSAVAERTASAIRKLIVMEERAFELAREGRRKEAEDLLYGAAYEQSKLAYTDGMEMLTAAIDERIRLRLARSERRMVGAGAATMIGAGALVLAWVGVVALIWRHLRVQARADAERKYLEAQIQYMQKLEGLGVLAGGIAHDFNNLLMPIRGNVDLVLADLPSESPHRARLERLRSAGTRLSELTNQLLAYSGRGTFVVRHICLSELIEEMKMLLGISVSKKASIQYDLPGDLSAIEGDASQLAQVVMNLVTNASEALGDEGGAIRVETGLVQADRAYLAGSYPFEERPEGVYVYLEVSDTGCGMDARTQRRVFDPFFTTKFTGRGLGLAVILGIVRGHHGAIRLSSEPGRGTTFRILFPCADGVAEPLPRKPEKREEWNATGGVLVVDDEPDVRELAEIMLCRSGFTVLTARDGREGVEAFREHAHEIDVVLLDLTMPDMGGEEVLREIQRIRPAQRVVLMSGYNEEFAGSQFSDPVAGFLQKPFTQEELADTLRALLQPPDRKSA